MIIRHESGQVRIDPFADMIYAHICDASEVLLDIFYAFPTRLGPEVCQMNSKLRFTFVFIILQIEYRLGIFTVNYFLSVVVLLMSIQISLEYGHKYARGTSLQLLPFTVWAGLVFPRYQGF